MQDHYIAVIFHTPPTRILNYWIEITDKKILNHPYPITEPSIQFNEPPRCITQITEIHHIKTYKDQSVE